MKALLFTLRKCTHKWWALVTSPTLPVDWIFFLSFENNIRELWAYESSFRVCLTFQCSSVQKEWKMDRMPNAHIRALFRPTRPIFGSIKFYIVSASAAQLEVWRRVYIRPFWLFFPRWFAHLNLALGGVQLPLPILQWSDRTERI